LLLLFYIVVGIELRDLRYLSLRSFD